jgi:selenophosphate synthetase-related protein
MTLAVLLLALGGCVILLHLRGAADVAAVKGEPVAVTKAVVEADQSNQARQTNK